MATYDLIIRNGRLVDGTGGPSTHQDIAIRDGHIAAIDRRVEGTAEREIDATGKLVTPGFVDVHTHYDGQATWDTHLNPSSNLGATTVVMGNCGVGFAPCRPADHTTLIQLMEGVEEIPEPVMTEGLTWEWESFPEYLDYIDARPRDIDIAALFPHGPLRVYVMGARGANREPATDEDIEQMKSLVSEAMDAGAVGFSTSRTLVHLTSKGEHVPTFEAASSELKALGSALDGSKGHVFQMIADWREPEEEFGILRDTAAATGAKATFTLLYQKFAPERWKENLARIEQAQQDSLDIRGQVISRPIGMIMGHTATMTIFTYRPTYRALKTKLSFGDLIKELRKPEVKAQILSEEQEPGHVFAPVAERRIEDTYPLTDPIEYMPTPDKSVVALAAAEGKDPQEWLYDYFLEQDGHAMVYFPLTNFTDQIPELLGHPYTVSALGDGGAHVGTICDTSANVYVLTKWVKERGAFTIEEAIRLLTSQPADLYSLHDRGTLAVGMKADINVIDLDRLALRSPHIVYDLPAGGKRLLQEADGLDLTIVSGEVIYENGQATGALPGKLVRGSQPGPTAA